MGKVNFDDMIALLLMDMIRNKSSYEYKAKIEEMFMPDEFKDREYSIKDGKITIKADDEMVGTVDRDLPYEYQMDRVKEVKDED